ncbi:GNAT family N-acetyltransferase [Capnocytophaga cynodegmi]|uniref:GNAT family N-acetyltransferase n=1 Tax=Capnocytophaga cynodegmi TaxID=28189 RepID=UPI0037D1C4AC
MVTFLTKELITPVIEQDARDLFSLLSRRKQLPLSEVFNNEKGAPFIACYIENGRLLGMASMAVYKVISGHKGWIEDVVVSESQRGKKIGKQLIQALIEKGKSLDLGEILLFTSADKVGAIKLYEQEKFKDKGVLVYVKALKEIYPKQ